MNLIKTSFLTVIATVIRVCVNFIINKVIAVYIGPSGLAVIGQLQNFITIILMISNGAIKNGVVKYTAEYQTIEQKRDVFSTSVIISIICSSLISLGLFIFKDQLSILILKDTQYTSVFVIFGLTVFLFALNSILMSILNGQKEIRKYVLVNIIGSIFSLCFTTLLIVRLNLLGALYAMVANQSIVFFVTLVFVIKSEWFKVEYFVQGVDKDTLVKLSKYSLMALTTAITVPVSHLIIRNYIGSSLGWNEAGYWQGVWYVSSMYLMVVTTSLSIYYLPKLSELSDLKELKKEIINGYKIIIPIVILLALMIYIFKELVVYIAFSNKFLPMLELFKWQLIGDVLKISAWLLSYLMLAKAMTKTFIYTEVLSSFLFVILSICFIKIFGLVGVTYAFSFNYFIYLLMMLFIFKKRLK